MINSLFLFTALECEAKPLIHLFGLKKERSSHPFALYKNKQIILTVTGVGKTAMAGGVAYTLALFPSIEWPLLVNIGIAGHKSQDIGDLFVVSKVVDEAVGRAYYPQLIGNGWPDTCEIKTGSKPVQEYQQDCLHDMEASGFYEMAVKFSSSELIHCIKIVSDNETSSLEHINAKWVTQLIEDKITQIEHLCIKLDQLKQVLVLVEPDAYDELLNLWHFTVSGKIKLKSLLKQWSVLTQRQVWEVKKNNFYNGKDVLAALERDIKRLNIVL